ncbi:hypothetical protein Tcan_15768 [Toxocara canis]|uniref:Uncharacterized protein n=1 Tax=Toxocara canis TaxID=6265 RepID=A0A0B2VCW5_TOXCA|nr:hypothetical protein Tcan_15768 [Toxocara canis]
MRRNVLQKEEEMRQKLKNTSSQRQFAVSFSGYDRSPRSYTGRAFWPISLRMYSQTSVESSCSGQNSASSLVRMQNSSLGHSDPQISASSTLQLSPYGTNTSSSVRLRRGVRGRSVAVNVTWIESHSHDSTAIGISECVCLVSAVLCLKDVALTNSDHFDAN